MYAFAAGLIVLAVATTVWARSTPAEKCAAAKSKAATKKVAAKLKCQQKGILSGAPVDHACLADTEAKFSTAVTKAEAKGGCVVTGDAALLGQRDRERDARLHAATATHDCRERGRGDLDFRDALTHPPAVIRRCVPISSSS